MAKSDAISVDEHNALRINLMQARDAAVIAAAQLTEALSYSQLDERDARQKVVVTLSYVLTLNANCRAYCNSLKINM